jgi:SagB-type dehydrogenase family enzyme
MKRLVSLLAVLMLVGVAIAVGIAAETPPTAPQEVALPAPVTKGAMSLEEAITKRRSVRGFDAKPLTEQQLSQLLWAAQGITDPATGHRAAPSAMARYPLTVYVCKSDGAFAYQPQGHKLVRVTDKDIRAEVTQPPRGGEAAPVSFVFTGDPSKFGGRFPDRAAAFVYLEVGHAAENLALEATALGLATVPQGGIDTAAITKALSLPEGTLVVYTMPVGYAAKAP